MLKDMEGLIEELEKRVDKEQSNIISVLKDKIGESDLEKVLYLSYLLCDYYLNNMNNVEECNQYVTRVSYEDKKTRNIILDALDKVTIDIGNIRGAIEDDNTHTTTTNVFLSIPPWHEVLIKCLLAYTLFSSDVMDKYNEVKGNVWITAGETDPDPIMTGKNSLLPFNSILGLLWIEAQFSILDEKTGIGMFYPCSMLS